MTFPNCRTELTRKILIADFDIEPLARVSLLPGQTFKGCCQEIKTMCFTFSYAERKNPANFGLFHVGKVCGASFVALTGKFAPALVNPLSAKKGLGGSGGVNPVGGGGGVQKPALNAEMYDAINLLTLEWGPPQGPLQSILRALAAAGTINIASTHITHLNNIIGKVPGRTLTTILNGIRQAHPTLRVFSFPHIAAALTKANPKAVFNF